MKTSTTLSTSSSPRPPPPLTTTTMKKYSEDYFIQRIQNLTTIITQQYLPTFDPNQLDIFITSCQSYQQAKNSWICSQTVVKTLQEQQQKHSKTDTDEEKQIWDDLITKAQNAVDEAYTTLENTLQICLKTSYPLLQQFHNHNKQYCRPVVNGRGKEEGDGFILDTAEDSVKSSFSNDDDIDDDLEATLLECTVLVRGGGPTEWAKWCAVQPSRNGPLLDEFCQHPEWMKVWMKAGGPVHGMFGSALSIYSNIIQSSEPPPSPLLPSSSITTSSLSSSSLPWMNDSSPSSSSSSTKKKEKDDDNNNNNHNDDNGNDKKQMRYKLAVAASLQLAKPVARFHSSTTFVDPVKRYWHYVQAYERGELDSIVSSSSSSPTTPLDIFHLRYILDCDASDEELQWGRNYLKAYRPDQILTPDTQWRYVHTVSTDVGYKHPDQPFDTYPEMISSGGECGPRAFFGRFILKAFGIPTYGVRQPGHAALSHYTPDRGWLICYGAAWKWSTWEDDRYCGPNSISRTRSGLDFYEETKARRNASAAAASNAAAAVVSDNNNKDDDDVYYQQVIQLECIADILGETVDEEVDPKKIWRSLALMQRKWWANKDTPSSSSSSSSSPSSLIPQQADPVPPSGFQLLHDVVSSTAISATATGAGGGGQIIIPAASFSSPPKPNKKVLSMPSFLGGGTQLHLEADGTVEYILPSVLPSAMSSSTSSSTTTTTEAQKRSSYWLTCRYVNIHRIQVPLLLTIEFDDTTDKKDDIHPNVVDDNGDDDDDDDVISLDDDIIVDLYSIHIEYTVGAWKTTKPIKVEAGPKATLKFSREPPCHGISIKDFTLEPCII